MTRKMRDLGLNYMQALHGVQSAIAHAMSDPEYGATDPKHMRVGIDASKAEQAGLAMLLINKGIITIEEYEEAMRLAVNEELAMHEAEYGGKIKFR